MIDGAKGIGLGIDLGLVNQYNRTGSQSYIEPEVLDSLVGVWSAYGMTNDSPNRSIIKNKLSNKGGDFVISNAAFKLNSGFGKYGMDFLEWKANSGMNFTSTKLTSTKPNLPGGWLTLRNVSGLISETKVKVSGAPKKFVFIGNNNGTDDKFSVTINNGVYTIPEFTLSSASGFYINNNSGDWSNLVIEQIPSFEGAFVTDGIDDLITSIKTVQEMGITDEVTVVSMIHQIDKPSNFITTNNIRTSGSVVGRNAISLTDKTGIYGWYKDNIQGSTINVINNILGDKADYTASASSNTSLSSKFSVVGYISNDSIVETSQVAWYWTIIANKVLTTDQINQVIAYFNLDRTLKPDILCNTIKQGITNENHAEFGDKLIDYSGNGRNIQLNNIAWKGDSGIGKYEVDFLDSSIWVSSNSAITSSKIDCKNAITHIMLLCYNVGSKEYPDIPSFKVIKTGADIDYSYIDKTGSPKSVKIVDGVNVLPASHNTLYSGSGRFCGFGNPGIGNSVTITQIPSHAGGLCLDGVNDFGRVTGMPIYKDYTIVVDYERISGIEQTWAEALISKSYIANQGAFVLMETNGMAKRSYSFGGCTTFNKDDSTRTLLYQSKYKCGDVDLNAGTGIDGDTLWLGTYRDNYSSFFNGAIYSLMSFPYSMSKFLIERQLKKHKLGTFYPNMVEFRPVINSNIDIKKINYWDKDWNILHIGDYVSIGNAIKTNITVPNGYKISKVTSNAFDNITIEKSSTEFIYDVMFYGIKKSPQKINLTIEQDENYVLFNPIITSNVEYHKLDFYLNNYEKIINIGDYIPKDVYLRANFYLKNNVDELTVFTFNGVDIDYKRSIVDDTAFNIGSIYNYDSPQEVNITIDEYIRYEDIVQPYPVLLRFNDENGNEVSWGGKFRVGSTITRIGSIADPESNLLNGLYSTSGMSLNGKPVTSSTSIVEKQMVFRTTATWLLDNNEPKVILSPSRLRMPNSSYKILGHIPDISGHGNHGVIHNSAYAEGSGVNEDGSYQFDGVDDFVTIPTTVCGKQMLMKVNWQKSPTLLYDQRASGSFAVLTTLENDAVNSRIAYQGRNQGGKTYIDGIENNNIETYTLKYITHNITIANSFLGDIIVPVIGCNTGKTSNFAKMSLYDFMLFDNISTDDKIKELNEYVGIEAKVELPPYYWDAYGKTNLDADKATIQQRGVAVGDYDLTNYNHAYEGMSGYNGYPIILSGANRTYQDKASYVNVVGDDKNVINLTRISLKTAAIFSYVKQNGVLTSYNKDIESFKIKVTGIDYSRFVIKYSYISEANATAKTTMTIASDSIYELPKSFASDGSLTSSDVWIGINFTKQSNDIPDIIEDVNVTIEVLPEYENGLVYDGIEDFSDNKNVPIIDDFTVIAKRTWLEVNTSDKPFIIKGDTLLPDGNKNVFLFEYGKLSTYSFGQNNKYDESVVPSLISWATPTSYNGTTSLVRGSAIDTVGIDIARATKIVLYKLILYPKTIPLLQINFLKNLMEKDQIIDLNNPIFIK